jgi:CS domain
MNTIADSVIEKIRTSTRVDVIMGVAISLAVILLSLILWYIIQSTSEEIIVEPLSYQEDDYSQFQKLLEERKERESISGSTPRYSWKQSEQEIDIFLTIDEYSSGSVLTSDIIVDIKATSIVVSIAGETALNDTFFAPVIPSECNWQIEETVEDPRRLCISLFKRVSTKKQNYWKCILLADENKKELSGDSVPTYDRNEEDDQLVHRKFSKMD